MIGQCCICGEKEIELSFEHVPPQKAYNDHRIWETNIQELVKGKWDGQAIPEQGKWVQGGAGRYTLCQRCNNVTGSWYGTPYITWAKQAFERIERSDGTLSLAYPYRVYPLRVLKQVTAMFCSACGPKLQERFPEIPKFVLDKERQHLPHGLRVFAYLIDPRKSAGNRQSPMSGVMVGTKQYIFAEIAFAPFGFILTGDVKPISFDLLDITHLGGSSYHRCETIFMKMPVLQINTWLPGDFRSKEDIMKTVETKETVGRVNLDVLGS